MAGLDLSIDVGARLGIVPSMLDAEGLEAVQDALWEVVFGWREVMQDAWPRDTGLSFSEWRSEVEGLMLVVSNPVEYAEYVHPAGEEEGASGELLRDALARLLAEATPGILQLVAESVARASAGLAAVAEQIGAPVQQIGGGLRAAVARAFAAQGGRARQRAAFPEQRIGQSGRVVISDVSGVLIRFRERIRTRTR